MVMNTSSAPKANQDPAQPQQQPQPPSEVSQQDVLKFHFSLIVQGPIAKRYLLKMPFQLETKYNLRTSSKPACL